MNELQKILSDVAEGRISSKYRVALQVLIKQKGLSLLRASYYDELLKNNEPEPLKQAMQSLHASRATIYRDYKIYKNLFEGNNHA